MCCVHWHGTCWDRGDLQPAGAWPEPCGSTGCKAVLVGMVAKAAEVREEGRGSSYHHHSHKPLAGIGLESLPIPDQLACLELLQHRHVAAAAFGKCMARAVGGRAFMRWRCSLRPPAGLPVGVGVRVRLVQ